MRAARATAISQVPSPPIQYASTCVPLIGDERLYYCLCGPGYSGDHCETIENMCLTSPCKVRTRYLVAIK